MLPIRDDQPRYSTPWVNYFLIGLNLVIFFFEWSLDPRSLQLLVRQFGVVPSHVGAFLSGSPKYPLPAIVLPFFTSLFLHASWMHVIGNMWFLFIFGDNVEDYLGHFKYLVFYLLTGVLAMSTHLVMNMGSTAPALGVSGALAGRGALVRHRPGWPASGACSFPDHLAEFGIRQPRGGLFGCGGARSGWERWRGAAFHQPVANGVAHEIVHERAVAEADLGFRRMHIDVHLLGIALEERRRKGVGERRHQVVIRRGKRVRPRRRSRIRRRLTKMKTELRLAFCTCGREKKPVRRKRQLRRPSPARCGIPQ